MNSGEKQKRVGKSAEQANRMAGPIHFAAKMNLSHSKLTDWGLAHISIENHDTILDVGCGGGTRLQIHNSAATFG